MCIVSLSFLAIMVATKMVSAQLGPHRGRTRTRAPGLRALVIKKASRGSRPRQVAHYPAQLGPHRGRTQSKRFYAGLRDVPPLIRASYHFHFWQPWWQPRWWPRRGEQGSRVHMGSLPRSGDAPPRPLCKEQPKGSRRKKKFASTAIGNEG